ncbi:hypothetical protein FBEOM_3231 [Fusarium beomiforme]|uniref:Uncharacterized protein n=1 Tax=Fusarium beomiforme TaxID=44412 RepID=A0A9P5DZ85_9HYPO|nr:hypothetical protein FBEOM_3231 [Fusarium beomiforme]
MCRKHKNYHEGSEFWSTEGEADPSDVVCIAVGHESFGREFWLMVKDCEIIEDFVRAFMLSSVPVEAFFDNLKEQYRSLKPIPGRRRITIEAEKVPETNKRITKEEVNVPTDEWGTDLDIQYIRQIYRDHGWPESFDLDQASKAINDWLEPLGGGDSGGPRGLAWPTSPTDWDESRWT